jgi:hypothetical protein
MMVAQQPMMVQTGAPMVVGQQPVMYAPQQPGMAYAPQGGAPVMTVGQDFNKQQHY